MPKWLFYQILGVLSYRSSNHPSNITFASLERLVGIASSGRCALVQNETGSLELE